MNAANLKVPGIWCFFFQNGCSVSHSVRLLAEWTAAFPYDFRDERVMAQVRQLTQRCVAREPQRRVQVSLLLQTLLERLTSAERFEEFVQKSAASKVDTLHNVQLVSEHNIFIFN
jgi:hypothetical protein